MKNKILLAFAFCAASIMAQVAPVVPTTAPVTKPVFIKGEMNIDFSTVSHVDSNGKPVKGVSDKYTFNVNISNAAKFHGTIERLPNLSSMFSSQAGLLTYNVSCDLINPKNPNQTLNVGTLVGSVPNDKKNVYRFADGDLTMNIESRGNAAGFSNKFGGLALGKPPADTGFLSKMKQDAINITRSVGGHSVTIKVEKYDKMEFENATLAAGPTQSYAATELTGTLLFDYNRSAWHFQNLNCIYADPNGQQHQDSLTGSIRWVEDADRKSNGKGEYEFNIILNAPPPSEDSVFSTSNASDESAFFTNDDSGNTLTGTMKYVDSIQDGSITSDNPDGNVTSSAITIDLVGHNITKQQTMYLAKLIIFEVVVPLNSN